MTQQHTQDIQDTPAGVQAQATVRRYHVTALSNLARAYEPYSRRYDKSRLPKCHFPEQFFLLREDELHIGVSKAQSLLRRLGLRGDALLVLATQVRPADLNANTRTGLGQWVSGNVIEIEGVYAVEESKINARNGEYCSEESPLNVALQPMPVEEAMARSLACLAPVLVDHAALRPRSVSILPIARACQAACRFCFSEASVSSEQVADRACLSAWAHTCAQGRARGAQRFVITGGGEPGLLPHADMLALIRTGRRHFNKGVLITNGVHLARLDEADRLTRLRDYAAAGLTTLALSRHHADAAVNAQIMGLDTRTERVLQSRQALCSGPTYAAFSESKQQFLHEHCLQVRLICVLQKGGVDSLPALREYLNWAAGHGVREICFKELYVATTLASRYHDAPENAWSHAQQVPLAWLMQSLRDWGFVATDALPWGAPVFRGEWMLPDGRRVTLKVAAYTEPTVFWERRHGMARSWNLMADGTCLASLEDPASVVDVGADLAVRLADAQAHAPMRPASASRPAPQSEVARTASIASKARVPHVRVAPVRTGSPPATGASVRPGSHGLPMPVAAQPLRVRRAQAPIGLGGA